MPVELPSTCQTVDLLSLWLSLDNHPFTDSRLRLKRIAGQKIKVVVAHAVQLADLRDHVSRREAYAIFPVTQGFVADS